MEHYTAVALKVFDSMPTTIFMGCMTFPVVTDLLDKIIFKKSLLTIYSW